jgi:hypothetical protein
MGWGTEGVVLYLFAFYFFALSDCGVFSGFWSHQMSKRRFAHLDLISQPILLGYKDINGNVWHRTCQTFFTIFIILFLFFHFFTFFNNNSHQNILTFFTFYIISIIFYYYSNKKIHYNTKHFHFSIQIFFTLYHIITFY